MLQEKEKPFSSLSPGAPEVLRRLARPDGATPGIALGRHLSATDLHRGRVADVAGDPGNGPAALCGTTAGLHQSRGQGEALVFRAKK